jgi:hypothetical protein
MSVKTVHSVEDDKLRQGDSGGQGMLTLATPDSMPLGILCLSQVACIS